ncbi:MAG: EF-hand domain-containing protein [Gammaproteobacteria bacterium]|nr:EF-hand domain-containing protein [Gammaproteobacteria bacterium]MBU1723349.1 EF-hand domain-containing protein [Gammaproteobacteria bacterium]MBU2006644.1 EF-hand domain-containing protein [Gammaproteobacteria bacterium]
MKAITTQHSALPLMAILLFSASANAATPPAHPDFTRLDGNRDGRVSWQEYAARNPVSGRLNPRRIFDNVDRNLDGYISRAEFDAMKQRAASRNHR